MKVTGISGSFSWLRRKWQEPSVISVIVIYEIIKGNLNKKLYLILLPILAVSISMYETCCQTFVLGLLICMLIRLIINKEKDKDIYKNFCIGILVLVASILLNYIILLRVLQNLQYL